MFPPKFTASVGVLLHLVWSADLVTVGVGLTVIVNETEVPVQPLAVGVTVIVPVIGAVVVLVAVNGLIFPLPLAPKPIAVLVLVQL